MIHRKVLYVYSVGQLSIFVSTWMLYIPQIWFLLLARVSVFGCLSYVIHLLRLLWLLDQRVHFLLCLRGPRVRCLTSRASVSMYSSAVRTDWEVILGLFSTLIAA